MQWFKTFLETKWRFVFQRFTLDVFKLIKAIIINMLTMMVTLSITYLYLAGGMLNVRYVMERNPKASV